MFSGTVSTVSARTACKKFGGGCFKKVIFFIIMKSLINESFLDNY